PGGSGRRFRGRFPAREDVGCDPPRRLRALPADRDDHDLHARRHAPLGGARRTRGRAAAVARARRDGRDALLGLRLAPARARALPGARSERSSMRAISRLVATSGLLLLGGVAAARLPLDYLPRQSFPELTVGLTLPEAREPAAVTRDWVEEIEAAIRSLGRVRGTAGEVRSDGAELRVRFAPGTDPESKAARLGSELTGLRRRLPRGARLTVDPAAQVDGNLLALVWLSGATTDAAAEAAAEELRGVPGVRSVEALGVRREELRIELQAGALDPAGTAARLRAALDGALRQSDLGRAERGDRRL